MHGARLVCVAGAVLTLAMTGCSGGVAEYWWASGARFMGNREIVYVWNYEKVEFTTSSSVGGRHFTEKSVAYESEMRIMDVDGGNDRRLCTPGGFLVAATSNLIAFHPGTATVTGGPNCDFSILHIMDREGELVKSIEFAYEKPLRYLEDGFGSVSLSVLRGRWGVAFTQDEEAIAIETMRETNHDLHGISIHAIHGTSSVPEQEYYPPGPRRHTLRPIVALTGRTVLFRQNEYLISSRGWSSMAFYLADGQEVARFDTEPMMEWYTIPVCRYHPESGKIRMVMRATNTSELSVFDYCLDARTSTLVALAPWRFYVSDISPDTSLLLGSKHRSDEMGSVFDFFRLNNVSVADSTGGQTQTVRVLRNWSKKEEGDTTFPFFYWE